MASTLPSGTRTSWRMEIGKAGDAEAMSAAIAITPMRNVVADVNGAAGGRARGVVSKVQSVRSWAVTRRTCRPVRRGLDGLHPSDGAGSLRDTRILPRWSPRSSTRPSVVVERSRSAREREPKRATWRKCVKQVDTADNLRRSGVHMEVAAVRIAWDDWWVSFGSGARLPRIS